jgi:hypothetical protein
VQQDRQVRNRASVSFNQADRRKQRALAINKWDIYAAPCQGNAFQAAREMMILRRTLLAVCMLMVCQVKRTMISAILPENSTEANPLSKDQ